MRLTRRLSRVWLVALCALAGCGRSVYLTRLVETRHYFAFLDRQNQNLSAVTHVDPDKSLQLRVPKEFQPIPAPKQKPGGAAAENDPRQPDWADLDFPGLREAFKTSLPLTGKEGRATAYLYVMSNYDLLGKASGEGKGVGVGADFNNNVIRKVAAAVGQAVPRLDKLQMYEVPRKAEDRYVEKLDYRALLPGLAFLLDDKPYRIRIYNYKQPKKDAQVSIVYVLPDNAAGSEKLDRAIDLSLETLEIVREKPTPGSGTGRPRAGSKAATGPSL